MACGGIIVTKNLKFLLKNFSFNFITFNFFMRLLIHGHKKQSKSSRLRPDTSSLVSFSISKIVDQVPGFVFLMELLMKLT